MVLEEMLKVRGVYWLKRNGQRFNEPLPDYRELSNLYDRAIGILRSDGLEGLVRVAEKECDRLFNHVVKQPSNPLTTREEVLLDEWHYVLWCAEQFKRGETEVPVPGLMGRYEIIEWSTENKYFDRDGEYFKRWEDR